MTAKVLQLIPSFHQGGSESQAIQLTRLLVADGSYDVLAACLDANGVLREEARDLVSGEIPEFRLTSFYDLNFARQLRRLCSFLKEENIQIVQTHDFYTNIFGMMASRFVGVPVRIAAKRETEMRTSTQAFVERRAFGPANVIAVNSKRVRDHLQKTGVASRKLEVIYNGIDTDRFDIDNLNKKQVLEELGIPAEPDLRLITIVANVQNAVKNQEMFIRAASTVSVRYPDTVFVMAGEGERVTSLIKLAESLNLNGRAVFLGRCRRVPELLAVSDVCVLTSRSEGFSNSILEYMAAAKPVVATDVGGASEAIVDGKTGFLVPSDNDIALAERLIQLLADPDRSRKMGEAGRSRVASEFSTEKQLERTLEIYDRELTLRGRPQNINGNRER